MVVFVLGNIEEGRWRVHACAINEDVTFPGFLEHLAQEVFEPLPRSDVRGDKIAMASGVLDLAQARIGLFLIAPDQDNLCTGTCHGDGHRAAQFAGAADDDGGLAFQGQQGFEIRHGVFLSCKLLERCDIPGGISTFGRDLSK